MNYQTLANSIPPSVLKSVADLNFDLSKWEHNPRVGELLSQTVLGGGKRIRPLITFLMADFFGISHDDIAPYGQTVELVHAATLAHDDVIDDATHRRGVPSINMVASNKKAILAGDYLLAYSVDLVAKMGRIDIVRQLSSMICDLAEGEWVQLENSVSSNLRREDIIKVSLCKTAAVMNWCCLIPAMLKNLKEDDIKLVTEVGIGIGLAFQMTDDILDFKRKDPSKLADVKNKVINSVIFEALLKKHGDDKQTVDMSKIGEIHLEELDIDKAIESVRGQIEFYLSRSKSNLEVLSKSLGCKDSQVHIDAHVGMQTLISYLSVRI